MVKTHLLSFLTRDWSMALSLAGSLTSSGLYCWAFTCLLMSSMSWLIEAWERNSEDKCATLLAKVTTWDSKRLNRLLTALFEKSREKKHFMKKSFDYELYNDNTVKPRLTATSLLQLLFLPPGKNRHTFSCKKKTIVNTANSFSPLVTVLTGFHCIHKCTKQSCIPLMI